MEKVYPKISIITPSFNQSQYLEETILSVIGQYYPNLEYIIIDGGSTDNSVEIIKKYEGYLTYWISEPDEGQADAINKGFAKSSGEILGWLNSDDMYLPGTLHFVSEQLDVKKNQLIFGNCVHIVEGGGGAYGSNVVRMSSIFNLEVFDYIIQPSSFWTRKVWTTSAPLNNKFIFAFDWQWFIEIERRGCTEFIPESKVLSIYRVHASHKTGTGGARRMQEIASIYRQYADKKVADIDTYIINNYQLVKKKCDLIRQIPFVFIRSVLFRLLLPKLKRIPYKEVKALLLMNHINL